MADHLRSVAALASGFSDSFGSARWGYLAGLWHDLGKYRAGFQRYIQQTHDPDAHIEGRVAGRDKTHSAAGALHALDKLGKDAGRILAFAIAGHHAGLPDWEPGDGAGASLKARIAPDNPDSQREYREALAETVPPDILEAGPPSSICCAAKADFALWVRMVSALSLHC